MQQDPSRQQRGQVHPRERLIVGAVIGIDRPSQPQPADFASAHARFINEASKSPVLPFAGRQTSTSREFDQGQQQALWTEQLAAARLTAENDQLRSERAQLLVELALRDAQIVELRTQLATRPADDDIEDPPHRRPMGQTWKTAAVRRVKQGVPFIHPDYLEMNDE